MPDSKITALASTGTGTDPANDPLVIVDVSDTSMSATGTTKKVTLNQLLATSPTATLASATITGDLTVDTNVLKVDTTNNRVGIVNASPTYPFDVVGTGRFVQTNFADNILRISTGGSTTGNINQILFADQATTATSAITAYNSAYGSGKNYALSFTTNGSERYLIDSTGISTWAVGGSTAMTLNANGLGVGVVPSALSGFGSTFRQKGVGSSGGIFTENNTATSWFGVYSGTSLADSAALIYPSGGTLRFATTTGVGVGGFATQMTLDASGNLLVGTTTTSGNAGGLKLSNVAGNRGEITFSNNSGSADYVARFNYGSTPTLVGNITVSSGGTSFVTTSDYRLKESVAPLSGGLARVNALKPSTYKWKTDGSNGEGFIAHELAEVVPAAVTGEKDAVNADGSIKPQGVDLSKVVPVLVAAIQELTARVQTLEAR